MSPRRVTNSKQGGGPGAAGGPILSSAMPPRRPGRSSVRRLSPSPVRRRLPALWARPRRFAAVRVLAFALALGGGAALSTAAPAASAAAGPAASAAAAGSPAASAAGTPPSAAGTFRVSQCAAWDGSSWTPRGMLGALWSVAGGWLQSNCGVPFGSLALGTPNWRLSHYETARMWLTIPASASHTSIASLWLDWAATPQAPSTNPAYVTLLGDGTRLSELRPGSGTVRGSADRVPVPSGTRRLEFGVWCSPLNGPGFCNWPGPGLEVRGLTLDLEEHVDPAVHAGGSLLDGTPQHGLATLSLGAGDADSGVRRVEAWLAGVRLAAVDVAASCSDDRVPVCPASVARTLDVDTTRAPDGWGRLRLHAVDVAGNVTDTDAGRVEIANTPVAPPPGGGSPTGGSPGGGSPGGGPPDGGGGGSPGDGGSSTGGAPSGGPAGPLGNGMPPGVPVAGSFPPNPLAGQGHVANGRGATGSARVIARLAGAGRAAGRITVPASARAGVRGRVIGRGGSPVAGALLTVVERRAGHRWRVAQLVRTRPDGHFTSPLGAGMSRDLAVVYRAYGDSPRARWSARLRLTVRARVTLAVELVGSGRRVRGRTSSPVPPDGVVVTIQRRVAGAGSSPAACAATTTVALRGTRPPGRCASARPSRPRRATRTAPPPPRPCACAESRWGRRYRRRPHFASRALARLPAADLARSASADPARPASADPARLASADRARLAAADRTARGAAPRLNGRP